MRANLHRLSLLFVMVPALAAGQASLHIDASKQKPISPFIYGTNAPDWAGSSKYLTLTRMGGNRLSAYNWENNASNAGMDYLNENDAYMGGGEVPGEAMRAPTAAARAAGAAMIMTIPMAGFVSADKSPGGDVNQTPNYLATRFKVDRYVKGGPFVYPPSLTDPYVYQDEFVSWMEKTFPRDPKKSSTQLFYCLDNEPDLWASTHPRIHPNKVTYAELLQKTVAYAQGIKAVAPTALVFGPESYGWNGYTNLQDATDANGQDFLSYYLWQMHNYDVQHKQRLLDVLDLHWYPEATGDGVRITGEETTAGVVQARIQAPRSLWDSTYTEDSWITQDSTLGPIRLIPLVQQKIASNYPGTGLAFSEYNYGGGGHISGGMAEADVLGVFASYGIYAAALWPLTSDESFINAGFDAYRNYDGHGAHFGDTSVQTLNSRADLVSAYTSTDSVNTNRMVVVVVNKGSTTSSVGFTISNFGHWRTIRTFRMTGAAAKVAYFASVARTPPTVTTPDTFNEVVPTMSVSVFEINR
jgi:hypothetical protein